MTKKQKPDLPAKAPKRTGKRGIGPLDDDEVKQRGKTSRLPGMEDSEIEELEDAAREYANIRDDRMKLTNAEVETKQTLLTLMKKHKKEKYLHDGVEVKVVHEKENVKVRIKKDKDAD